MGLGHPVDANSDPLNYINLCCSQRDKHKLCCSQRVKYINLHTLLHFPVQTLLLPTIGTLLLSTWQAQTLLHSMCDVHKTLHSAPLSCTSSAPLNVTCTNTAALNVWRIQTSALCSIQIYKLCSSRRDKHKLCCFQCVTYTNPCPLFLSTIQTLLLSMCDVYKLCCSQRDLHKLCCS